jgi:CheY-like chemotaxis protein
MLASLIRRIGRSREESYIMYRHIRILVAEDNPHDAFFLKRAFLRAGINAPIQFVANGEDAVKYLGGAAPFTDRQNFPLPNMMMLDLKMPRLDGFEVLQWLRQQPGLKRLPVIIFTSSAEPNDVDRAHELGANGYAIKPAGVDDLFTTIQAFEKYWLQRNCFPSLNTDAPTKKVE